MKIENRKELEVLLFNLKECLNNAMRSISVDDEEVNTEVDIYSQINEVIDNVNELLMEE